MHEEIEIEFKHMLTLEQFQTLLKELPFPELPIVQTNYYFETNEHTLINKRCALRIRLKHGTYQCTFKEPHPEGILETHDDLTKEEAEGWMKGIVPPIPHILRRLDIHDIDIHDISYIGSLTTDRYTYDTDGLQYVLDLSLYGENIDYELEIEATSYERGNRAYKQIVDQFQLPSKQPITKIERFLREMLPLL